MAARRGGGGSAGEVESAANLALEQNAMFRGARGNDRHQGSSTPDLQRSRAVQRYAKRSPTPNNTEQSIISAIPSLLPPVCLTSIKG
jgi:hypothetical protein